MASPPATTPTTPRASPSGPPFGRGPAVALAHALVDHLARHVGVRALAIKGPVLTAHGLRDRRTSSDADVLVDPAGLPLLQDALVGCGWQVRYERAMPYLLERHSVPLVHPGWPVDIDLHRYFPGCHAEPAVAFERFWEHRAEVVLAGRPVRSLDLVGSTLVAGLHCLRHPASPHRQRELAALVRRVHDQPVAVREEVRALAVATRSASVLAPLLQDLAVAPVSADLTPAELVRWRRYTHTHEYGSTGAWLAGLSTGGWRTRVRTAVRAIWPSAAELAQVHPHLAPLGRRDRLRLRAARWRRGAAAFLPTLQRLWRSGRER